MRPENPSLDLKYFAGLSSAEKLKHLIKFAALAPSSHNTQPWLFKIVSDKIELYINPSRELSYSDPTRRQMYLSIGAAIENLIIAAEHFGFEVSSDPLNLNDSNLVSIFNFRTATPKDSSLVKYILTRQSNRFPFEPRIPDQNFLDKLKNLDPMVQVNFVIAESQKKQITEIVASAAEVALDDQSFRNELSAWVRPSLNRYDDGMPGYTLGMPFLLSLVFPKILKNSKMGKQQKKMDTVLLNKTPAFVILSSAEDNKESWVNTGRVFERIALMAEKENVKISPLGAPIEVGEFYKDIQKVLNLDTRPQMFLRLGYTNKTAKFAPRLNIEKVLK
ncbi:MAG: nitroreductase [Candidatus Doudnabacteria bacterium]|nr:nitroreductase [Candidatus Doudnabacteria bacterium]